MKKIGNYIVGASVIVVLAGDIDSNVWSKDNFVKKIENVKKNIKEIFKNDNTVAWEKVANNEEKLKNENKVLQTEDELKNELKKDSWEGYKTIRRVGKAPRIENLCYQNDTIGEEREGVISEAYYKFVGNTITDNIFEKIPKQSREKALSTLAHEVEHMHQYEKINFNADMSLEQHYKLHCYKEIGAKIAGLLQLREMYKEAKTSKERNQIVECCIWGEYDYYFRNIEKGEINPFSEKRSDFDKEMCFIAQKTISDWMFWCSDNYDRDHTKMVLEDIEKGVGSLEKNDKNYKEAVGELLNIGGIRFADYVNEDIEITNLSLARADEVLNKTGDVDKALAVVVPKSERNLEKLNIVNDKSLQGFSLEQRYILAVNNYFASFVKKGYLTKSDEKVDIENVKQGFEDISQSAGVQERMKKLVESLSKKNGVIFGESQKKFQEKLREIWMVETKEDGQKVCFLDAIEGGEIDFGEMAANRDKLREKDNMSWIDKVKGILKEKVFGEESVEESKKMSDFVGMEWHKSVKRNERKIKPVYEMETSGRRSEVLFTSEIIDTRTNYLKEERENRKDFIRGRKKENTTLKSFKNSVENKNRGFRVKMRGAER